MHDEWAMNCLLAHSMGCVHCRTGMGKCTSSYAYPKTYFPFFQKYMLQKKKDMFLGMKNMVITAPSAWLVREVQKTFLSKFDSIIIYNGVDTSIFKTPEDKNILRLKYDLPINRKIITFSAANLKDKNKGIDFIIDLAKKRKDFLFLGIGSGDFQYDNIVGTGYIEDSKKLAEMYGLSDVFISASQAETFSFACAEAMNCGIPIVAIDLPVLREVLTRGAGIISKKDLNLFIKDMVKSLGIRNDGKVVYFDIRDFLNSYKLLFK